MRGHLWFIPTTHRIAIAVLLAVAVVAFFLFLVTWTMARRQGRRQQASREVALESSASVRHGFEPGEPGREAPAEVVGEPATDEPER